MVLCLLPVPSTKHVEHSTAHDLRHQQTGKLTWGPHLAVTALLAFMPSQVATSSVHLPVVLS